MTRTKCNRCGRAIEVRLITRCDWCDGKVVTTAVEYTPEERAFYDRLAKHNGSEQALRAKYISISDLKHRDFTPEYLEERLHDWIKGGVLQAYFMAPIPIKTWPPTLERK